jgi:hypothetical protein
MRCLPSELPIKLQSGVIGNSVMPSIYLINGAKMRGIAHWKLSRKLLV